MDGYGGAIMRKDMSKVIVERPRHGHADRKVRPGRTRVVLDDDGEPVRAKGAREPKGRPIKTKSLNENLSPLKRYLAANVGRPWNKVFSEISEHLKPNSTVQQHVRDHLVDFVAIKTRMQAGKVMVAGRWGGEHALNESYQLYYVHPRTGLLRKNEKRTSWQKARKLKQAEREAERAKRMRVVDAKTQLHRLKDDIWWEVTLAKVKLHRRSIDGRVVMAPEAYKDVVFAAKLSSLSPEELYGRYGVYAAAKRQLNKAEKKKLGLA
jgi:hypothetical protein